MKVSKALDEENDDFKNHVGIVVLEDAIGVAPWESFLCEMAYFKKFESDFKTTSLD